MGALGKEMRFSWGLLRGKPFSVLIQITNRCNMRCSFCDFWPNGVPPAEELTLEDFKRLSAELAELGTFLISIEGGEPMVRPDLVEIVRALAEHHLTVLYTNGWYVTPALADELFAAGLTQVGVSIDYPQAERHDAKRGLPGATEKAWAAIDTLLAAAPHKGKQVHVMSVIMEDNWQDLDALLTQSQERGAGHCMTLLASGGYRRGEGPDQPPPPEAGEHLVELWDRYPHLRWFRGYFEEVGRYLQGAELPTCRAGIQSFNVDHTGNVSPCIEKIDRVVGNLREESLSAIHARMVADREQISTCQDCYTACRGFSQAMGQGGTLSGWRDLSSRMRSR